MDSRQIHHNLPTISHATIKLTDKCNLNCDKCQKVFCPSCIKEGNGNTIDISTITDVIKNLKNYRCKTALLTGGEVALVPNLKEIYDLMVKNGLNIVLNTNGIKKLDNYFINCNILISVFSKEDLIKIIANYRDFENITILKYFDGTKAPLLPKVCKYINRSSDIHQITRKSLLNMSIDRFHVCQTKNACLDGKIVINECGDVYPCLEAITSHRKVGNINESLWEEIVRKLCEDFWNKKIDEHKTCKNCEFRYACNSCIFDDVEKNCSYDMEVGVWK